MWRKYFLSLLLAGMGITNAAAEDSDCQMAYFVRDMVNAEKLCRESADKNNARDTYTLALVYRNGGGRIQPFSGSGTQVHPKGC